jgi:hypothetical protein
MFRVQKREGKMKNRLKRILSIIIIIAVLISPRLAFSKGFESVVNIPQGSALVYLYRPFKISACVIPFVISIGEYRPYDLNIKDERLIIEISNASYYPIFLKPGEILFHGGTVLSDAVLRFEAKAGQTYYIEAAINFKDELLLVPSEVGEEKIKKCKLDTN